MVKLKPGDRVNCRLNHSKIVKPYDVAFDDEKTFEIIGIDDSGYYLFVPNYMNIVNSEKVDYYYAKEVGLHSKFIGEEVIYILESMVYRIHAVMDGCFCTKCKNFYDYAQPNQPDGTLVCWSCRAYPIYQ